MPQTVLGTGNIGEQARKLMPVWNLQFSRRYLK